jgi:hypothetical protein
MDKNMDAQSIITEIETAALKNGLTRARSLTCGTCFNGMVEIMMRGDGNNFLWAFLNPAEVYDYIHQLAASIGSTAEIKQRTEGYKFQINAQQREKGQ